MTESAGLLADIERLARDRDRAEQERDAARRSVRRAHYAIGVVLAELARRPERAA